MGDLASPCLACNMLVQGPAWVTLPVGQRVWTAGVSPLLPVRSSPLPPLVAQTRSLYVLPACALLCLCLSLRPQRP